MTIRYIRIAKFVEETGYTARAVETKINRGVWIEGREYRRAPDGSILIDMKGYCRWVESGTRLRTGAARHSPNR